MSRIPVWVKFSRVTNLDILAKAHTFQLRLPCFSFNIDNATFLKQFSEIVLLKNNYYE